MHAFVVALFACLAIGSYARTVQKGAVERDALLLLQDLLQRQDGTPPPPPPPPPCDNAVDIGNIDEECTCLDGDDGIGWRCLGSSSEEDDDKRAALFQRAMALLKNKKQETPPPPPGSSSEEADDERAALFQRAMALLKNKKQEKPPPPPPGSSLSSEENDADERAALFQRAMALLKNKKREKPPPKDSSSEEDGSNGQEEANTAALFQRAMALLKNKKREKPHKEDHPKCDSDHAGHTNRAGCTCSDVGDGEFELLDSDGTTCFPELDCILTDDGEFRINFPKPDGKKELQEKRKRDDEGPFGDILSELVDTSGGERCFTNNVDDGNGIIILCFECQEERSPEKRGRKDDQDGPRCVPTYAVFLGTAKEIVQDICPAS